jgi:hypothetical protein
MTKRKEELQIESSKILIEVTKEEKNKPRVYMLGLINFSVEVFKQENKNVKLISNLLMILTNLSNMETTRLKVKDVGGFQILIKMILSIVELREQLSILMTMFILDKKISQMIVEGEVLEIIYDCIMKLSKENVYYGVIQEKFVNELKELYKNNNKKKEEESLEIKSPRMKKEEFMEMKSPRMKKVIPSKSIIKHDKIFINDSTINLKESLQKEEEEKLKEKEKEKTKEEGEEKKELKKEEELKIEDNEENKKKLKKETEQNVKETEREILRKKIEIKKEELALKKEMILKEKTKSVPVLINPPTEIKIEIDNEVIKIESENTKVEEENEDNQEEIQSLQRKDKDEMEMAMMKKKNRTATLHETISKKSLILESSDKQEAKKISIDLKNEIENNIKIKKFNDYKKFNQETKNENKNENVDDEASDEITSTDEELNNYEGSWKQYFDNVKVEPSEIDFGNFYFND